jgi:GNAT superfamily N-acetyltransferase
MDDRTLERARAHGACDYVTLGGFPLLDRDHPAERLGGVARRTPSGVRVAALGLDGPVTPDDLDGLDLDAGVEVTVCPSADSSLLGALRARGFAPLEFETVLAGPLIDVPAPPELRVERVLPDQAALWAAVIRDGSGLPEADEAEVEEIDRPLLLAPGVEAYVAWRDDEPVGAGALALEDGLVTLFATAVRPGHRRTGVHRALLAARLARARALGAEGAVMATLPSSRSEENLIRAGFAIRYSALVTAR